MAAMVSKWLNQKASIKLNCETAFIRKNQLYNNNKSIPYSVTILQLRINIKTPFNLTLNSNQNAYIIRQL